MARRDRQRRPERADVTDSGTDNWTQTTRTVPVTAVDPVSGVDHIEWQLDGGAIHSGANGTDVPIIGDGSHILRTRAFDVAGNVSVWHDHTVKVDTVDPTDETVAPGGWQRAGLGITVTGSDAHSGVVSVTYDLDGTGQTVPATSTTVTVNGDGDHVLTTYVTDRAGRTSTQKTFTIKIDGTAPVNTTPKLIAGWRGDDYAVVLNGADSGSGLRWVEWRVDGGPVTRDAAPLQATVTGNGTHSFETRALDAAGNASGWRSESVKIDKTAPINTTPVSPAAVPVGYSVTVTGTDPRLVPEAAVLEYISYQEATELAYFGAKVIHPSTMAPAIENKIPIWIRNTFNSSAPGTKIHNKAGNGRSVSDQRS